MDKLHVFLYSSKGNLEYKFISSNEEMLLEIKHVLMCKCSFDFSNSSWVRVINDEQTLLQLKALEEKYENQLIAIRKLYGFASKLNKGDFFYCLFADNCTIAERKTAIECIQVKDNNWKVIHNHVYELQKKLDCFFEYHSYGFDGLKVYVGNRDYPVCRFCEETDKKEFSDKAHAIGESLGNKTLFCYEECNKCNHSLNKIEDNFLRLMDIRRAMYHINRKDTTTIPTIHGSNFAILPNEDGSAELYIMQEAIDSSVNINKPFTFQLKQHSVLSDEKIYKALAKMVIDLIPSNQLCHFRNTIKWIKSDGFLVDSLPSIWFCHNIGKMYRQPYLDIFINSKLHFADSPYCTAALYIYDIAYIYVMPLVDVDAGKFKYNHLLEKHWQRMFSFFGLPNRELQDFSEDRPCYPWAFWDIDPANPHIHILTQNHKVFEGCQRNKDNKKEICFSDFSYEGISVITHDCKYKCHYSGLVTDDDLFDITQHLTSPSWWLLPNKNFVDFHFSLDANDTTDSIPFFSYDINVRYKFADFYKYIELQYNKNGLNSVAIDWHLRDFLFNLAMSICDYHTEPLRKGTPFEKCKMSMLIDNRKIIETTEYFIPQALGETSFVKILDKVIHPVGFEES